jgi:signal peptidase II
VKNIVKTYLPITLIAGWIIVLDQITKALVRATIPLGGTWTALPGLQPYARIVNWYNTGVAFGLFQNMGWLFAILAVIVSGVIIYYYPKVNQKDWLLRLALSMQLAGALGNLIDRIAFSGKVTDFISVGNFAVFNVADSSISVGVALMVLDILIQEAHEKKLKAQTQAEEKKL